jgi:hypothetical protein
MEEKYLETLQKRLFYSMNLDLVEEATKQSFIIPFISYLGYDVLNPNEVLPEFKAGDTTSDAVDYALCFNKKPVVFIEAKRQNSKLVKDFDQLKKYVLSNDNVNVGVITNGLIYVFFIKSDDGIEMNKRPFYQFNICRLSEIQKDFLMFFKKTKFSMDYLRVSYSPEEIHLMIKDAEIFINKKLLNKIFGEY